MAGLETGGRSGRRGAQLLGRGMGLVRYWRLRVCLLRQGAESLGQSASLVLRGDGRSATVVSVLLSVIGLLRILLTSTGMTGLSSGCRCRLSHCWGASCSGFTRGTRRASRRWCALARNFGL